MIVWLLACAEKSEGGPEGGGYDPGEAGIYTPARSEHMLEVGGRVLTAEVWYPSEVDPQPGPITDLVDNEGERNLYTQLLEDAPTECPTRTLNAGLNLPLAEEIGRAHV